jgi:uncharacterized membrane protein
MMHWRHGYDPGAWLGMAVVVLLSWIILIVLTYALARLLLPDPADRKYLLTSSKPTDPFDILDRRLARGDIDPADYRLRKELLADRQAGLSSKPS